MKQILKSIEMKLTAFTYPAFFLFVVVLLFNSWLWGWGACGLQQNMVEGPVPQWYWVEIVLERGFGVSHLLTSKKRTNYDAAVTKCLLLLLCYLEIARKTSSVCE